METTPFDATPAHARLARLVGSWGGTTLTWIDPNPTAPPDEARTRGRAEMILGGRYLRWTYSSTVSGKPHSGELTIGHDGAFVASLIDSFHTAQGILLSTQSADPPDAIVVLGSYAAGPERWGWRTEIRQPSEDELVMLSFNITPSGEESRGIETRLKRL